MFLEKDKLEPRKRTAADGRTWWCVYNTTKNEWSTITYFGKYRTKCSCKFAINFFNTFLNKKEDIWND